MDVEALATSLLRRITSGKGLLVVAAIGGLLSLFRALTGPTSATFGELVILFILLYLDLALAPVPWQWAMGPDGRIRLGRGLVASLLFNALWVALFVRFSLALIAPHPYGGLPGPPGGASDLIAPVAAPWLINVTFAIVFGWTLAEKEAIESREHRTSQLLQQAQAKVLRNQLEPHVLFNALNDLSELVHEDPLAAEEALAHLADLYRTLTLHGKEDITTLGAERKLVEQYLGLEQIRLSDRLRIHWDWPDWADEVRLPPLFLQPLVENAIKHGIGPCVEGGELMIRCIREEEALVLGVANTGNPLPPQLMNGVGLENLRARLGLWEGIRANFRLTQDGIWTRAEVRWWPREVQ